MNFALGLCISRYCVFSPSTLTLGGVWLVTKSTYDLSTGLGPPEIKAISSGETPVLSSLTSYCKPSEEYVE